jgi:hypothetical protein
MESVQKHEIDGVFEADHREHNFDEDFSVPFAIFQLLSIDYELMFALQ